MGPDIKFAAQRSTVHRMIVTEALATGSDMRLWPMEEEQVVFMYGHPWLTLFPPKLAGCPETIVHHCGK